MDTIRPLRSEELSEHFALSQFAFQYESTEEQIEQARAQTKPEHILGHFVDDHLAAQITIIPLQTFVQGQPMKMGGIAGVSTWPEYRRKGLVGKLLVHGLRVMKERGQTVSFLAPFSFPFYRKYGWETYVDRKAYTVDTGLLPIFPDTGGHVKRNDDLQLLNSLYEPYAQAYNGTLKRDADWWTDKVLKQKKGKVVVYFNANDVPRGYMIYQVRNRELNVDELVFLDDDARKGLWRFIYNHDSMIERVKMIAPADDPLPFLLANPRIKQEISPYFMARIVDVASFLQQYPFRSTGQKHAFALDITDSYAPWNSKRFAVHVNEDGRANIEAHASVAGTEDLPLLSCDIQTLSTMLFSFQRPSLLRQIGRIQGSESAIMALEQLVLSKQTYLLDFF